MHLLPREVRAAVDGRRTRAILPNLFKVGGCYYAGACQESSSKAGVSVGCGDAILPGLFKAGQNLPAGGSR